MFSPLNVYSITISVLSYILSFMDFKELSFRSRVT